MDITDSVRMISTHLINTEQNKNIPFMSNRDIRAMHIANGFVSGVPITEEDFERSEMEMEEMRATLQSVARISYMMADALEIESKK